MINFVIVKKVIAILFLSIYLASTTEFIELLKFPTLVEHYLEHKEKNKEISLAEFIAIHYEGDHLDNHPEDDDYDQDQRLPFLVRADLLSVNFVIDPPVHFPSPIKFHLGKQNASIPADDQRIDSNFHNSIWQPPKFA